jgi:hypothetical protein
MNNFSHLTPPIVIFALPGSDAEQVAASKQNGITEYN